MTGLCLALVVQVGAQAGHTFTRYESQPGTGRWLETGTWGTNTNASYSSGTARANGVAGSTIQFSCPAGCASIQIGFQKGPTLGFAAYKLDDAEEQTVDLYAAVNTFQQELVNLSNLTYEAHTVTVRVTNTKNAASSGFGVVVDYADSAPNHASTHPCAFEAAGIAEIVADGDQPVVCPEYKSDEVSFDGEAYDDAALRAQLAAWREEALLGLGLIVFLVSAWLVGSWGLKR